jgi:hypothetical protein
MRDLAEVLLVFAALFLPGYLAPPGDVFRSGLPLFAAVASFQTLLLLYLMSLRGQGALAASGVRRPEARDLAVAIGAAAALLVLAWALSWVLSRLGEAGSRALEPRLPPVAAGPPGPLALLSLVTGYREELFYRCYLITRLAHLGLPGGAAVAAAGVIFGLGHLYQGPAAVALAMVQALVFGVLLRRGASLHGLAVAHGLYNFAVLVSRQGG